MHDYATDALSLAPLVFLLVGLTIAVLRDNYTRADKQKTMLLILAVEWLLTAQNYADYLLQTVWTQPLVRIYVVILGYSLRPVIFALFFRLAFPERKYWATWVLIGLNAALHMTALRSGICFTIDLASNIFVRGRLGYASFYVSAVLFLYLVYRTLRDSLRDQRRDLWLPVMNMLFIAAAVIYEVSPGYRLAPASALNIALVCSSVFYYLWLHLKFVRAHEQELLDKQRFQLMLSQIQPHFLFNSLTAIRETYRRDTARGDQAITEFASYLRHNMDSLSQDAPIPFTEELKHVQCYLDLQRLRFGSDLSVELDLPCTDFRLPTLTLQPLVENAVTYGVRKSETGRGTVVIRTREYPDRYEISVTDDGPGFVPDSLSGDSERSHTGLRNVRERLQHACRGELRIDSAPGAGTTATILLPREAAQG